MKNILKTASALFAFYLLASAGLAQAKIGASCMTNASCARGEICLSPDADSRTQGTCIQYQRLSPLPTADKKTLLQSLVTTRGNNSLGQTPAKMYVNKGLTHMDEKGQPVVMGNLSGYYKDYGVEYGSTPTALKRLSLKPVSREAETQNASFESDFTSATLSGIQSGITYYRFYGTTVDGKSIQSPTACFSLGADKSIDAGIRCSHQGVGSLVGVNYITNKSALLTAPTGLNIIGN